MPFLNPKEYVNKAIFTKEISFNDFIINWEKEGNEVISNLTFNSILKLRISYLDKVGSSNGVLITTPLAKRLNG